METLITIIGSIASVIGAFVSVRQARKSKEAADKSEQMRDQLINQRKMVEVSQVHHETRRILRIVSKIGPSCNPELIKGVNCTEIAQSAAEYVSFLLEQSEHFSYLFENDAKDLCDNLNVDIESLSEAVTFEDKKKYGKSIYYKIQSFMPKAKQLSDDKRENAKSN